jgi:hypothetical protein
MPQPSGWVELEAAAILLGVDHVYPAGADHQVVEVGPAAGDGQVVQDHPPLPLQPSQETGGAPLPHRPPPPGSGVGAGPEPQPPARQNGRQAADQQAESGRQQAAKNTHTGTDPENSSNSPTGAGP